MTISEIIAPEPILQFILSSSQIYYRTQIVTLTEEDINNLTTTLPSVWWNEKDRLVYFTFFEDGSYFCEREKDIYSYTHKQNMKYVYEFNVLSKLQAKELYEIIAKYFEEVRIQQLRQQKDILRQQIKNQFDYITVDFLSKRRVALIDSDWTQLSDVSLNMDERERMMWIKYRQYLRDMPETKEWQESNFSKVFFPADPKIVLEKSPQITIDEYLTDSSHFIYYVTLEINTRVNALISTLKMPSISIDSEILKDIDVTQMTFDQYQTILDDINSRLERIDPSLSIEINVVNKEPVSSLDEMIQKAEMG
jgi:hypothetical protein